jgi:hypothetical protein
MFTGAVVVPMYCSWAPILSGSPQLLRPVVILPAARWNARAAAAVLTPEGVDRAQNCHLYVVFHTLGVSV